MRFTTLPASYGLTKNASAMSQESNVRDWPDARTILSSGRVTRINEASDQPSMESGIRMSVKRRSTGAELRKTVNAYLHLPPQRPTDRCGALIGNHQSQEHLVLGDENNRPLRLHSSPFG
jgi:hypothetical protein